MAKDIKVEIVGDASKLKKSLGEAEAATGHFDKSTEGIGKTLAKAFGAAEVANFAKEAVTAASDYNETISKSKVIFGEAATAAIDFAEGAASSFGLSEQAALDAEATFAVFGKGAGIAGDELVGFSQKMTGLAADMASFSNTSPEQAIEAIGAALRGESEPIRAYGVLLDDATLKARAMTLGIYKGTGSLTQQQRVLAAQAEILAQTTDAQGDFARTSDGMAGQMKIATAELENMKVQLGQNLIPLVVDAAKNLIWVTKTLGPLIDKANSATDAIGGLSTGFEFLAGGPIGAGKALWDMKDALTTFTPLVDEATAATSKAVLEMVKFALTDRTAIEARQALNESLADDIGVHGVAALNKQMEFQSKAATDAAKAADDLAQETLDLAAAQIEAIGTTGDLEQQIRDVASGYYDLTLQIVENAKTQASSKITDEEKAQSQRDLETAVHNHAGEVFALAEKYGTETGAAQGSKEQHDRMLDALKLNQAQYPLLAGEIQKYIDKLYAIPGSVSTEINVHSTSVGKKVALAEGGIVKASPGGTSVTIGEGGHDEAVIPLDGNHGLPGGGGNGGPLIENFHVHVMGSADQVTRDLAKFVRRNGPGPLRQLLGIN